ncbi:hypothetical protein E2C01_017447 [Portunus trituberculatus]|uniref:Uncharacterized protein n=1 Tax=Portunus trituberculatus TaxID=210409 RepID=A0A5B7DTU3_PORTR|nr:hypothetical protein [Portunus trituberculatus]
MICWRSETFISVFKAVQYTCDTSNGREVYAYLSLYLRHNTTPRWPQGRDAHRKVISVVTKASPRKYKHSTLSHSMTKAEIDRGDPS